MESWRERGFVPDSDDEDESDSQKLNVDIGHDVQRLDYIAVPSLTAKTNVEYPDRGQRGEGDDTDEAPDPLVTGKESSNDTPGRGPAEHSATETGGIQGAPDSQSVEEETTQEERIQTTSKAAGDKTPKPFRSSLTANAQEQQSLSTKQADSIWDFPNSSEDKDGNSSNSQPTLKSRRSSQQHQSQNVRQPQTPPAKQHDISSLASSSPDELSLVPQPASKPRTSNQAEENSLQQVTTDDDSPLSSLPSGYGSQLGQDEPETATEAAALLPDPNYSLEDILSGHDMSEDVLRELTQPMRRSFRHRNPIQLHPYLLEDARYRKLMQAKGIKPVRMVIERQIRQKAGESQDRDSYADTPQSSPPAEEYLPPARPERNPERTTAGQERHQHSLHQPPNEHTTVVKRRKISHSDAPHDQRRRLHTYSRPRVVSDDNTSRKYHNAASIYDVPPSPPRSGSASATRTPRDADGFIYPPGSSPPERTTSANERIPRGQEADQDDELNSFDAGASHDHTPRKDYNATSIYDFPPSAPSSGSTSATRTPRAAAGFIFPPSSPPPVQTTSAKGPIPHGQEADQDEMDSLGTGASHDYDAQSVSSRSQQSSDTETGSDDEAVRRLQRRIRGVLPASWLRVDQKMQGEKQKPSHRERHAAAQRPENAKGVARKIIRRADPSQASNHRGLIDLGDSDADEDDARAQNTSAQDDTGRKLSVPGFEDLFDQGEDDIPEDNRIDYMFPPIPRQSSLREQRKGLKRPKSKGNGILEERQHKKARLKRQTRLTDASYGGRRTKQSTRVPVPKLGILDAPDVAERPRKEQPQFLRVAARGVRSRRDGGRRSPTRKFFKLASNLDTADANESLRGWKKGSIQQAKFDPPQARPRKHQSPTDYSSNRLSSGNSRGARTLSQYITNERLPSPQDRGRVVPEQASCESHEVPVEALNETTTTERPAQREQRGHQWVVRRNVAISSLKRNAPRPAATNVVAQQNQSASKFQRSLATLNKDPRREPVSQANGTSLTLDRYLSETGHRRLRKRTPKRVNIESDEDQEPAIILSDDPEPLTISNIGSSRPSFYGASRLSNWQRSYSVDFAVKPLRDGTFFHESTFIGSGEFSRSLHLKRDLDRGAASFSFDIGNQSFRWSAWNDMVSSEMGHAFGTMIAHVEKSATVPSETGPRPTLGLALATYRSLIKYVTEKLTFIDPVDRTGFVTRALCLVTGLRDALTGFIASSEHNQTALSKIASCNLVFANQIYQIASHMLVDKALADEALDVVKNSAKDVVALVSSETGMAEMHRLFHGHREAQRRESGLREEFPSVEAYVVTRHLLHSSERYQGWFEDLQIQYCTSGILRNDKNIRNLELGWRSLFTFLPLNEMDQFGIARKNSRFGTAHNNWTLVKQLLSPVLGHYDTISTTQPIAYYAYCRTLLHRCYHLINTWGWRECKTILDTLYDFFARRTLYNLKLEESRGSPSFLDELDRNPCPDVRAGEPCFHALLKVIASGLRFLAQKYPEKKILGFVWRLLPNHGRVYPKEKELHQDDLDALRNHHDLLCTLYWAVPDGCRPRLSSIRNLVDPARSHRETCSISLRSWTRLVRFKLSTDEAVSGLDEFADWHGYFVTELLKQRSLARTEIESQSKGDNHVSRHLVESTIAQNERQIESLLNSALRGMQGAVEQAPSLEHARRLVSKMPFESLLALFNSKLARVNIVVSGALQVIVSYTRKDIPAAASTEDDSQEYGWADIADALRSPDEEINMENIEAAPRSPGEGINHVENVFHPVVARLVSNCFGADTSPEDAILLNVVDCWTSIALILVRHGLRYWDNYLLNPYEADSWVNLLPTIQTRKFTPQFLAACIEKDTQLLSDYRMQVLGMWMTSLVERSSMLKFQHRLTQAVLNESPEEPLLGNLPFLKDSRTGRYTITLEDLTQRRLSLISSLLSNMREHVRSVEISGSRDVGDTKQEYREHLLRPLMTAMKKNYEELGHGAQSVQGSYVDFVHRVVEFLQQYTNDIGPIDPFFTDSSSFPLPSTDPLYIVAKLKAYEPKLVSDREVKTLTMFIQSMSERTAIDGEQRYLVDQLHASMRETYEAGDAHKPTLRSILLQCVFPAYLEAAFLNRAAWLLSRPIIQTIALVFKELLLNLDSTDSRCLSSIMSIFDIVFRSSYNALSPLLNSPFCFKVPTVLLTLATFLDMISSSLVVLNYIDRTIDSAAAQAAAERAAARKAAARGIIIERTKNPITGLSTAADTAIAHIRWFRDFAVAVRSHLCSTSNSIHPDENEAIAPPEPPPTTNPLPSCTPFFIPDARRLASKELKSCLDGWSYHQGKYYIIRRGMRHQEVNVEAGLAVTVERASEAKVMFEDAAVGFMERVKGIGLLRGL